MSDMGFRPTGINWNAGGKSGTVNFGNDENLLVMFYNRPVENPVKSQEMGRRFFENHIYVKIQHPGETANVIDRPVNEQDKNRFRNAWSAFVQNRTQIPDGTSIDLLFPNHPAVGENLRAMGIYTIEQCAALSANAIDNIGRGGQEYVNRAKKYLDSADKGRSFHLLQAELDKTNQQNKILEQQIRQLKAQLDQVMGKINDPVRNSLSPPFIPGHDAQTERINANHVTKELSGGKKKKTKPVERAYDPLTDELAGLKSNGGPDNNMDINLTEGQDGDA